MSEPRPPAKIRSTRAIPAQAAIAAYADGHPDLVLAGAEALELVTNLLDEAGINYLTVSGRTKSVASFAEKAVRAVDGRAALRRPVARDRRPARDPGDHLRPRRTSPRSPTSSPTRSWCTDDRDLGRETASEGRFGYASRHLQITLDAAREGQPGVRPPARPQRPGADPHGAPARLGGVRARHPLQGHGAPPSTPTTSTGGSRWPPGSWSSPTRSSPPSATGSAER